MRLAHAASTPQTMPCQTFPVFDSLYQHVPPHPPVPDTLLTTTPLITIQLPPTHSPHPCHTSPLPSSPHPPQRPNPNHTLETLLLRRNTASVLSPATFPLQDVKLLTKGGKACGILKDNSCTNESLNVLPISSLKYCNTIRVRGN